jgi:single-stranded DNA-binding protein
MNICAITISGIVNRVEAKNIGGTPLCKLGVKVRVGFGEKARNVFFNVDIWGKPGEAAIGQLRDGSPVVISGKLEPREYEGKNGTATSLDIRCTDWAKPRNFEEMNDKRKTDRAMQSADSSEVPF